MSDSINFNIGGVTKLAIPFVVIFIVNATKDVICKWLDMQHSSSCSCNHNAEIIKNSEDEQNQELSENIEVEKTEKQIIKNKIVDNYHKNVVSCED
ncbi:Hypothetical protein PACV_195 [Pacmanvirus A23]|uniref:Hypothetical protein n=1 Tax=Pacmanvirus A23 TaxID=1932881 RepID=UPI000A091DB9|nr:Hypothetical protein B9W72_gp193 [Pacmanvirus A23]SIP85910.1 Hypothetical protein PACV_195 [Pacmanvirus A23]